MILKNLYHRLLVAFMLSVQLSACATETLPVHPTPGNATNQAHFSPKRRLDQPRIELILQDCELDTEMRGKLTTGIQFLYDFYHTRFDFPFTREVVVKIRIFGSTNSYRNYLDTNYPLIPKNWVGVYLSSVNEILVSLEPDEKSFFQNIFHETSHLLLSNRVKNCPNWVNEGLAEYFEYMEVTDAGVIVKPQLVKDRRTKRWIAAKHYPDLFTSFGWSNKDWNTADGNSESDEPRTVAWSVIYFLMASDKGTTFIQNLIPQLAKYPGDPKASLRAIDSYYPGGRRQFEKDWRQWTAQPRKDQQLILPAPEETRTMAFLKTLFD